MSGQAVYLRSSTPYAPWGVTTNEEAMDAVFGVGNWQDSRYQTVNAATVFSATTTFVFMEGGDATADEMEAFLNTNQTLIENWVNNGGRLFLNSAPNEGNGMNYGFNNTLLVYPSFSGANNSFAAAGQSSHPIFNSPNTPVGTSFAGGFFNHATITCPVGCSTLMVSGGSLPVLVEKPFGSGLVMFGGMTTTNFHQPQPNAFNLRKNILYYLYNLILNNEPTAVADSFSTDEDTTLSDNVLTNDTDSENDALSASLVSSPSNASSFTLNSDGSFSYTPAADFNGMDSFTYKANDGQADSNVATVSITVNAVNDAPVLSGVPANAIVDEEVLYNFTATATDVDSTSLQFSLVNAPTGAAIDASTGGFSWTPTESQGPGVYNFKVRVTDDMNAFDEKNIQIQVLEVNVEPELAGIGNKTVDEQTLLTFTAAATDVDLPANTLSYSLVNAPAGAAINLSTGVFTWTPTEAQGGNPNSTFTFTVKVTDDGSPAMSDEEEISVTVNEVNVAPVLSSISNQTGVWGNVFSFTASATDADIPANTLTYSLVGAPVGASINSSTGAFSWTPLSSQIGSHTFKVRVTDDGSPSMSDEKSVTINVGKRPTTLVYGGDGSEQYSDSQALSATLTDAGGGAMDGNPLSGKTVGFAIGSQNTSAATNASGVGANDLILTQNPAPSYTVDSSFAGDSLYLSSSDSDAFDITQEDARVYYTGMTFVNTSCATCGTAATTLSATIRDITAETTDAATDSFAGDISNATVTFVDRDNSNAPITGCIDKPVQLVSSADTKTGTVTCNWTANIGNADSDQFTVGIVVGNYYSRNASTDNEVITVSKPIGTNFITGGGYIVSTNSSAGLYAGGAGLKTNFGFNVKYSKSGKNLQGNVNIIVRAADGRVYQIKGNRMDTLTVNNGNPNARTAVYTGKANITDITDPLAPVSLGGGHSFQMSLTDKGEPGKNDTIGITLYENGSGALLFSSNWSGTNTIEQLLNGGNLVIR